MVREIKRLGECYVFKKRGRTLKTILSYKVVQYLHYIYAFFKWQIRITVCTIYGRSRSFEALYIQEYI